MRTLLFLACEAAIQDRDSNAVSIINVLEEISAAGFPIIVAKFTVVLTLQHEANDPDVAVITFHADLNQQRLFENPVQIAFQGRPRARAIINLLELVIYHPLMLKRLAYKSARLSHRVHRRPPNVQ
jgi:hypothetical protein